MSPQSVRRHEKSAQVMARLKDLPLAKIEQFKVCEQHLGAIQSGKRASPFGVELLAKGSLIFSGSRRLAASMRRRGWQADEVDIKYGPKHDMLISINRKESLRIYIDTNVYT